MRHCDWPAVVSMFSVTHDLWACRALGKMWKCIIRNAKVKHRMKNAESYCRMVGKMRNAERLKYLRCISPVMLQTNVDAL